MGETIRVGGAGDAHGLHDAGAAELLEDQVRVHGLGGLVRVGLDAPDVLHAGRRHRLHQIPELRLELGRDGLGRDGARALAPAAALCEFECVCVKA